MDNPDHSSTPDDPGDGFPSSPEYPDDSALQPALRPKRRNRADPGSRSFKCGCGKNYLSYPALYTHIKQKHGGASPEGTDVPVARGTKSRGRPRKQLCSLTSRPVPQRDITFLHRDNLMGGPSNILSEYFFLSYPGNESQKNEDAIYSMIEKFKEDPSSVTVELTPCDEVFALYLMDWANRVKPEGYHLLVLFAQKLRQCLNTKGWEHDPDGDFQNSDRPFCEVRSAKNLPEISNYFITEYIEEHCPELDKSKAIDVMLHFNCWLFSHRYSNLKISLIANE